LAEVILLTIANHLGADYIEDFDFSKAADLERLVVIQKVRPGIPISGGSLINSVSSRHYFLFIPAYGLSKRPSLSFTAAFVPCSSHPKVALTVDKAFVVG
jgi:hypothetical protein